MSELKIQPFDRTELSVVMLLALPVTTLKRVAHLVPHIREKQR